MIKIAAAIFLVVGASRMIKLTYVVQAVSFASAILAVLLGFLAARQGNYALVANNAGVFLLQAAIFISQIYVRRRQRRLEGRYPSAERHLRIIDAAQLALFGDRPTPKPPDRCPHCGARDWATLHTTYKEQPVCRACWRRPA